MREKIAVWISQRHVVPYRLRKSLVKKTCPKILTDYQFEINFYGMKYVGNTKDSTDRLFFMFGGCEKYMLSLMKDYYTGANKKKFVFLDIGAHVGNHSLFMSKYASEIHAFEPNPIVRGALNSKIYVNDIKNITVHPIGLGNASAKIPFYLPQKDHLSVGSFKKNHDDRNEYYTDLDVRVGDEIVSEKKIDKVEIIKIDVEGFEREVIEGLKNTIDKNRPVVIAELSATSRKAFGSKDDFESIFPKEYSFFQFSGVSRERAGYKIATFDYDAHKGHMDVIAIPNEKRVYFANKITKRVLRNKTVGGDN